MGIDDQKECEILVINLAREGHHQSTNQIPEIHNVYRQLQEIIPHWQS